MHDWLLRLTRPEDHLLWAWVAIAAGYAAVGVVLGLLRRRARDPRPDPQPVSEPGPRPDPS